MRLKASIVILATLLAFGSTVPASADAYKWIDSQGITHYSQLPPLTGPYTVIQTQGSPGLSSSPVAPEAPTQATGSSSQQAPKSVGRNEIPNLNQRCQQTRQNLQTMQDHARLRMVKPDGSVEWLVGKQREQQIQNAKDFIAKYCAQG